jgi:predicted dehydrogenase
MDIRKELAEQMAAGHGARVSTRVEDLLADEEVQGVVISTPHSLHDPLTVQAAKAGKHVLCEKPIACTLAQADSMIGACERAGVKLGILLPVRLGFDVQKARELVAAGAIGRVHGYQIHAMLHKPAHYWKGGYTGTCKDDWRTRLATSGGGVLMINMVHNLDCFIHVLDPRPQRIYAEYATLATAVEVEDYASFVMRLVDGPIVSLDASSAAPGGDWYGDRVYGEKGQIAFHQRPAGAPAVPRGPRGLDVYLEEPFGDMKAKEWIKLLAPADYPEARRRILEDFAKAALEDGEPAISGRQSRRSLEIVRGAYLSMQRGGPVEFPVVE